MDAKELLIASTQELLWERGYVGTSPGAILQRSGVGQGSMYHHFSGKPELARVAIERSAENLRAQAERQLSVPGTAIDKVLAFLLRERHILRGCQIGRLAMDPEIVGTESLRRPVDEAFQGVRQLLTAVLAQGVARQELRADLDVAGTTELILAVLQGGYVLARAANSEVPFRNAIGGLRAMLQFVRAEAASSPP